jgi:RNA polymerase-interacting CarD/CdnL/TRCF family regulator
VKNLIRNKILKTGELELKTMWKGRRKQYSNPFSLGKFDAEP